MGWFFLYIITCVANTTLISTFTGLNLGDAVL